MCIRDSGIGFHGLFRLLDLLVNSMETVCRLGGFLRQLLIIGQVIVLYIGKSGGHLLNVKYLSLIHIWGLPIGFHFISDTPDGHRLHAP